MVKKELIREELLRIQEIMGIKQSFVNEAVSPVFMSKALVKQILKNSKNLPETLRKIFNATDQQVDLITSRIDDVGGVENLTDDLLEGLAKKTIDNVDDLVKLLKAGNFFGSDFNLISKGIFDKIDTLVEISPNTRIKVIDYYKKSLDDLPFLENADEIKGKLVRDFQSEFDEKFAERITKGVGSSIDDVYDAFLNTDIVSDIPENAIPKNSRDILERSMTDYKNFI
jgi:DNA-binding ferritin-like protein